MTKRNKVELEDIIGLVKTDEVTNSVELKKELYNMTEKRFVKLNKECRVIKNIKTGETAIYYDTEDGLMFLKWLNNLSDENEQLKQYIYDNLLKRWVKRRS